MAGETVITVIGNLVDDPEIRYTPSGVAVANFRIASTPRTYNRQSGQWEDGETLFLSCSAWRQMAENVAESLRRGMRVIVRGALRQRAYTTKQGEKRTVFELDVDDIGPSLRTATVQVAKAHREGQGQQPWQASQQPGVPQTPVQHYGQQGGHGLPPNDPWAGTDQPPF